MASAIATLTPEPYRESDEGLMVRWNLHSGRSYRQPLSYRISNVGRPHLMPFGRADHVAVATLLWAMEAGRPIHYHGQVSPALLAGLEDLQRIWSRWRPDRYRMVTMTADEETEVQQDNMFDGGLFAFSGGVDSAFSLFRHLTADPGRSTISPQAALFVHGFDIPVDQRATFDLASARAETMLEGTGVSLLQMSTDFRRLSQRWVDAFGLGVASCILLISRGFGAGVKGSEEPYDSLVTPWGSTPITDPLIHTRCFNLRHDGAEYDRTEKVGYLARSVPRKVTAALRVCWQGDQLHGNCGICEKCVRTALNFWAAGAEDATPDPLNTAPELVVQLKPRNNVQLRELMSIRDHAAARHKRTDPRLKALNRVIAIAWLRLGLRNSSSLAPLLSSWPARRLRPMLQSKWRPTEHGGEQPHG